MSEHFNFKADESFLVPAWGEHHFFFVYPEHIACSRVEFHHLQRVMKFCIEIMDDDNLPSSNMTFLAIEHDNHTILRKHPELKECLEEVHEDPSAYLGEYFWVQCSVGDAWSENTWNVRLNGCLRRAKERNKWDIDIIECFKWNNASLIKDGLKSIFYALTEQHLHVTPFYGCTDFFLRGKNSMLIRHSIDEEVLRATICIEVGINRTPTVEVFLTTGEFMPLPKKLAELLASMYMFGSLNQLNELRKKGQKSLMGEDLLQWKCYGIFLVPRSLKLVEMELNKTECKCTIRFSSSSASDDLPRLLQYLLTQNSVSDENMSCS